MSVSDAQPSFTVVSSIHSHDHVELKKEAIGREPAAQPSNTSDAVRQMLQDEMFKLLQVKIYCYKNVNLNTRAKDRARKI